MSAHDVEGTVTGVPFTGDVWAKMPPTDRVLWWSLSQLPYPMRALKPWADLTPDERIYLIQSLYRIADVARAYEAIAA